MKKRRISIAAFLAFATVSLGVGYAALTDSFTIYGDLGANIDNENLVVEFTSIETDGSTTDGSRNGKDDGYCALSGSLGATSAELSFHNLDTKGSIAWADLTVTNNSSGAVGSELDAQLSNITIDFKTLDREMFDITATWEDAEDTILSAARTEKDDQDNDVVIDAESNVIKVKVELLRTPTSSIPASKFVVTFTATAGA